MLSSIALLWLQLWAQLDPPSIPQWIHTIAEFCGLAAVAYAVFRAMRQKSSSDTDEETIAILQRLCNAQKMMLESKKTQIEDLQVTNLTQRAEINELQRRLKG
jgi:hypothetical protein